MSDRKLRIEQSTPHITPPDARLSNELRRVAIEARTHEGTSQQERLDNAPSSNKPENPDVILKELCPQLGKKQDKIQASISRLLKEASEAEKKGDNHVWIQATKKLHQAQNDLTDLRSRFYDSENSKPEEELNPKLVHALDQEYLLSEKAQHATEKIQSLVDENMRASGHAIRLNEAEYEAAYKTTEKEIRSHYLLQIRKEMAQAKRELYNIENELYKNWEKAEFKNSIRNDLNKKNPYEQKMYIDEFKEDIKRLKSALLSKYPHDQELKEKAEQISPHDQSIQERETRKRPDNATMGKDILESEIEVMATKRIQLEWLSSQKWREMREQQLWPKASEDIE